MHLSFAAPLARIVAMVAIACLLAAFCLFPSNARATSAPIDPGPFGPTRVTLGDGRVIDVPAETYAFFRMLTRRGRIHGTESPYPPEAEIEAGLQLRRRHEPLWAARYGDGPRTPDHEYVFPVEGGDLPKESGYNYAHRAEDIFAPVGRRIFAPARMLIVHAGYLSRRGGQAVVGFIPADSTQSRNRYVVLVHIDATPAKPLLGTVAAPGTVIGTIVNGDEAVAGNAFNRPPHLHFVIREEQADGWLQGIRVWDLLRQAVRVARP